MTSRVRSLVRALARYVALGLTVLIVLWALIAGARWTVAYQDSVTLPSGMQLKREFNWDRYGRWDLFGTNGKLRLALYVDLICFNDRYVYVQSDHREFTGLYDAKTDSMVSASYSDAMAVSGLSGKNGCAGYYTAWVGPGLLLDNGHRQFVPSCAWRNVENKALRNRTWFERACAPEA